MKKTLLLIACLLLNATSAYAQNAGVEAAPDEPSRTLLKGLRANFHPKAGQFSGIKDSRDVDKTMFGDPISTSRVSLSLLQAYDGTQAADALIFASDEVTRLITVDGNARSCMVLGRESGKPVTRRIGGASRAAAIDSIGRLLARDGVKSKELSLVQINELGLEFVAYREPSTHGLMLTSLYDVPQFGLVVGQPMVAESVLASLAPVARSVSGY
jgi:hypothetical protein